MKTTKEIWGKHFGSAAAVGLTSPGVEPFFEELNQAILKEDAEKGRPATMKVTIMYRNSFHGGDGWTYYPMTVEISTKCAVCGGERGTPTPHQFFEDGEWFTVDRWENPCNHLDHYRDVYLEAQALKLQP